MSFEGLRRRTADRLAVVQVIMLLVVLLAFGLRVFDLDGQSMWNDEGLSVYRARQSIPVIIANTISIDGVDSRDTNPPLYFLLLHFWRVLAGESVFALRFFGVLIAVLNAPLIYRLGRYAFDPYTGLAAAFFLAISPFHVWQSQELRNYSLLLFLNLLSVYGLFRYILAGNVPRHRSWLLLWGTAGLAAIYVHYFGVFVFAFGVLVVIWQGFRSKQWHLTSKMAIALLILSLAIVPVIWMGLSRFIEGPQRDFVFVPIHHLLSHAASAYAVGIVHGFVQPLWRVAPAIVLAVVGMIAGWFAKKRSALLLVLGYLLIPFLLLFLLSGINPLYNGPRHLFMGLPPFILLVSAGLALPWSGSWARIGVADANESQQPEHALPPVLWRAISSVFGLLLVFSQVAWLNTQFTADMLVKDDLRGLANYLSTVAREGDTIVIHDSINALTFDYYYEGKAPWTGMPSFGQFDVEAAIERLQATGDQAQRIWFVTEPRPRTGFPRRVLYDWARDHWVTVKVREFPSLWLKLREELFVPEPTVDTIPNGASMMDISWDDELRLLGFESPAKATSGSYWQPAFYWSKETIDAGRYGLSIRLEDEEEHVWLQLDQPLWQDFPPAAWSSESIVRYEPVLALPAGIPPGEYGIWLRVSRQSDQQPLKANGEVEIKLPHSLVVEAATAQDAVELLPPNTPLNYRFAGEIELKGYYLSDDEYRPGHALNVDLFWQVHRNPSADYLMLMQLVDGEGQVIAETLTPPSKGDYLPTMWNEGELLHGQATLIVPAAAKAGPHTVRLALIHPQTDERLAVGWPLGPKSVVLTEVQVAPWPFTAELPAIPNTLQADFGQPALVRLQGYELADDEARAAGELELTLYWQALSGEIEESYTVFVHLVNEDGEIVVQGDSVPLNGFRPTNSWREGEVIVDTHMLKVPEEAADDTYQLWLGLYDPLTSQRLPIFVNGKQQPDDRLLARGITLENGSRP
jgi:4-amino-4-deoxy-L-arabinose transferase-like glycosyltransferase